MPADIIPVATPAKSDSSIAGRASPLTGEETVMPVPPEALPSWTEGTVNCAFVPETASGTG